MTNPVFSSAMTAISSAFKAVEDEVTRLSGIESQTRAAQDNIKVLEKNADELRAKIKELHDEAAKSRQAQDDVERNTASIKASAQQQAAGIIADAQECARKFLLKSQADAQSKLDATVKEHGDAKGKLAETMTKLESLNAQVAAAQAKLDKIRSAAREFAGG